VRELQNLAQRLVIFADAGVIDTVDLPTVMRYVASSPAESGTPTDPRRTLREVELEHILTVLESVGGNKTKAAAILGIDRKSLRERLKAARPGSSESTTSE
jgi:DNA-binding NtrC family response regulator